MWNELVPKSSAACTSVGDDAVVDAGWDWVAAKGLRVASGLVSEPSQTTPTGVVGLIVNPRSGSDVRRVIASAATSTLEDKISIVRRLALGAAQVAPVTWKVLHEPHEIMRRAVETRPEISYDRLDLELVFTEEDTVNAAAALKHAGADIVVVLGGDGTNRAAAKGWIDLPVLPLSTGTNNAFPYHWEPTVAGVVLGLVAGGVVTVDEITTQAKVVHITAVAGTPGYVEPGGPDDLALIDAVAVDDRFVGSLDLFDPDTMQLAVLTRADPAAIGFSSVGGLVVPVTEHDDHGLLIRFEPPASASQTVVAPTAPGHHTAIGYTECRPLPFGETVEVDGPVLLAVDGERKLRLKEGDKVTMHVDRDGPRVVDVAKAMQLAVERKVFVES